MPGVFYCRHSTGIQSMIYIVDHEMIPFELFVVSLERKAVSTLFMWENRRSTQFLGCCRIQRTATAADARYELQVNLTQIRCSTAL